MSSNNQNGFSLIEVIVGTLLGSILFTAALAWHSNFLQQANWLRAQHVELRERLDIDVVLQEAFRNTRSQRLVQSVAVASGSAPPPVGLEFLAQKRLLADSDTLAVLHVDSRSVVLKSRAMSHFCCSQPDIAKVKNPLWLVLGSSGAMITRLKLVAKQDGLDPCPHLLTIDSFTAEPELSQLFGLPTAIMESEILTLMPIADIYAIYADDGGTLRRRSLISATEQPLLENVAAFNAALQRTASGLFAATSYAVQSNRASEPEAYQRLFFAQLPLQDCLDGVYVYDSQ